MIIILLIIFLGLSCYTLGYLTCRGRLQKKVDEFVLDHSRYEDDDNPPGSL